MSPRRWVGQITRSWATALSLAASIALSTDAIAQGDLGGAVGAAVPLGGSADFLDIGQQSGVFVLFRPPGPFARARLDLTWAEMQSRAVPSNASRFFWTAIGIVLKPTPAELRSIRAIDVAPRPIPEGYVILGAGAYHQKRPGAKRDAFGVNAGAGIEFALGPFGAFGEARIHLVGDGMRTKLFPVGFGLRF